MADAARELTPAERTPEVTAFAAQAEWTGVTSTDRAKWLALRKTMLTASDVAAILGEDPHRSALDVYVDKITPRPEPEVIGLDDPRFWGTVLEQPVLRAVAAYYGWGYREGGALLRSRKHPQLGATLDAEVDRHDGKGWIDFEGKTTRITRDWNEEEGDLPTRVLIQVQSQILVSGTPTALVFALLQGSRPCQIEIEPSDEFHRVIVEATEEFMDRVRRMNPPDPDGSDASKRALQRLYPLDDGSVVRLPPEAADWTREIKEIAQQQKALEARVDELKNKLRKCIGSATYGMLPEPIDGKTCWRWQNQKRAEHVVRASESRVLLAMKNAPMTAAQAARLPMVSAGGALEQELAGSLAAPTPPFEELLERSSVGASNPEPPLPIRKRRRSVR